VGIAFRAADNPEAVRGATVAFTCHGEAGELLIRRVDATDDPHCWLYAAELLSPSVVLMELLLVGTELSDRASLVNLWNRGD
jgi:hypothetical protein